MKVHVFASDILPLKGFPVSSGGLRSWQIIAGLKNAGFKLSFSMPRSAFLVKANQSSMKAKDKSLCWSRNNQHRIIDRIKPQIAIWCDPLGFSLQSDYKPGCTLIADLQGPANMHKSLASSRPIRSTTRELIEQLARFDHFITFSLEQKHYFAALICAAGIPSPETKISVVPVAVTGEAVPHRTMPKELCITFCSDFLPWQVPSRALMNAAKAISQMDKAVLHVYGSPQKYLSSARLDSLMSELSHMRQVKLLGFATREALAKEYAKASCALDLFPGNMESDLAFVMRTLEHLSFGVPSLYSRKAPLAKYLSEYDAGWCLNPEDLKSSRQLFRNLVAMPKTEFERKSRNARYLAETEFDLDRSVESLVKICKSPHIGPSRQNNRSVSTLKPAKRLPRIAVFTQDNFVVKQARVVQPLDALKRAGLIAGYTIFLNEEEQGPDLYDAFDAIWIQRTVMESVGELVDGRPFLFDIDDLLIGQPSYTNVSVFQKSVIESLISKNCVLSVSNDRLHRLLKKYIRGKISNRVHVTPNGFDFPRSTIAPPAKPNALIWTSSDAAALTTSYDDVLDAIDQFSCKWKLPVYLIGRFNSYGNRRRPQNAVQLGNMDFWRHKAFLASQPTMIGICPLETHADEETLDFIEAKSDIKMVEYGGFGHPAVYSQSPPYERSDLKTGILSANTSEKWLKALEDIFNKSYKSSAKESENIRKIRHIDYLAKKFWFPALEEVLLDNEVPKSAVMAAIGPTSRVRNFGGKIARNGKKPKKDILLFGAGSGGAQTFFSLPKNYECLAFIDNDTMKQKTKLFGIPVISPAEIEKYKYDTIIISSMFVDSIEEQLWRMGIESNKIERGFS
jgi:hypothetical protein